METNSDGELPMRSVMNNQKANDAGNDFNVGEIVVLEDGRERLLRCLNLKETQVVFVVKIWRR
jgi:hypothetical protein